MIDSNSKITAVHQRRNAYVYVRQSTAGQVAHNRESLERQYELRERAVRFGWNAEQVVVVDDDLGQSGKDAAGRLGFQGLVADVGLGRVGLILGIEVSRLARCNADWSRAPSSTSRSKPRWPAWSTARTAASRGATRTCARS